MEIIFHSHANKTHLYKKGCAPSLILKVRVNFWNSEVAYYGMMSHTLFKVTKVQFLACTLERKWKLGKIGHRKIKS